MYEIGNFIRDRENSNGLGLHVQTGANIRTGEPIAYFVGSVPASLYYIEGATAEQIERAASFGARFGPPKRYFPDAESAWAEAERRGYARCALPDCTCNVGDEQCSS